MDYIENDTQKELEPANQLQDIIYKLNALSMLQLDGVSEEVSIGHYLLVQSIIAEIEKIKVQIAVALGEAGND